MVLDPGTRASASFVVAEAFMQCTPGAQISHSPETPSPTPGSFSAIFPLNCLSIWHNRSCKEALNLE